MVIGKQVLAFGKSEKSEFIYIGSFGLLGVTRIWGPNIGRSRRNRVRSHVCWGLREDCLYVPSVCSSWNKDTIIMPRLIWVFAEHSHFVGFVGGSNGIKRYTRSLQNCLFIVHHNNDIYSFTTSPQRTPSSAAGFHWDRIINGSHKKVILC